MLILSAVQNHINACIDGFKLYYRDYSLPEIKINPDDALMSIRYLNFCRSNDSVSNISSL
jgi:hypothetical protein